MRTISAEIISIGNELLNGFTVNGNAAWLGRRCWQYGYEVKRVTAIADQQAAMHAAFDRAAAEHDIILVTGGLGPTHDDITKRVVCDYFATEAVLFEEALVQIERFFSARGRPLTTAARHQAELPKICDILPNRVGTASGMLLRQNGHVFIFMPGVPKEMQAIMDDYGWQKLQSLFPAKPLQVINLRTIGVYESRLSEKITDLITQFSDVSIAFLPSYTGVTIRLSALPDKQTKLQDLAEAIRHRLGHLVFAEGEESIANVVGRLLLHHHQTIAIAESCSGGLVSHWLTENPGSSAYIHYNQVTYSNRAKQRFLGVSGELLEKHGAVSDAVAEAMARGARERAESDYSLAITGIAGPDGGTQDKPVGLVYIALCHPDDTVQVKQYNFHYDRSTNKVMTAAAALNLLRLALLGAPDFAA